MREDYLTRRGDKSQKRRGVVEPIVVYGLTGFDGNGEWRSGVAPQWRDQDSRPWVAGRSKGGGGHGWCKWVEFA